MLSTGAEWKAQPFKAAADRKRGSVASCLLLWLTRWDVCTRQKSHTTEAMIIMGCLRRVCTTQIGDIYILGPEAHFTQARTKKYPATTKPHRKPTTATV